ncbi:MAG: tetratricopeptide repeat protein [Isosphaeraceae bacterium]|nr:tetratricopeptide repeat protein [Isosphaeraceae bacterium]
MSAYLDRALVLYQQSRFDLAERELRRSLADDPDHPVAHALLAFCLASAKRLAEALDEAQTAIRLAPGLPFAHYALATVLYDQRRLPEAEEAIQEAIRLDPEDADHFTVLAAIQFDRRRWAEALKAADQGLALDPENLGCANYRAMALVKLGRKREAGATIQGALARDPENALTHANQGWTLLHQGDHRKALEHFREALRIDPELDWARVGIVEALKARHFVYRVMLRYFLWMSTLSGRAQWVVLLAVFFGPGLLGEISRKNPWAAPVALPLAIGIVLFAFLTWVADPLFNLLLRVNKFGRYALARDQVAASNGVGLCLLGALLTPWPALVLGYPLHAILAAVYFLLMILPIAVTFRCPRGWPRLVMGLYTLALAGAGALALGADPLLGLLGPESWPDLPRLAARIIVNFPLAVVISTWLAAGLTRAR